MIKAGQLCRLVTQKQRDGDHLLHLRRVRLGADTNYENNDVGNSQGLRRQQAREACHVTKGANVSQIGGRTTDLVG